MTLFNSLGSNYNFKFVLKAFFSNSKTEYCTNIREFLENKYHGKATLLYKGREAIELALKSLNLPAGSYIAINGFTCFAVYEAIKKAGLEVEYLDIEKGELNFSPQELEEHLKENPKVKVVIVQNTLGYPCDIESISKICKEKKLILIEDLTHSVGTKYENGKEAGTVGDMTVLSFSQDKIIDGISGGALISKSEALGLHLKGVNVKKQIIDRFYPLFTYLIRITYPVAAGKIIHQILKGFKLLSGPMDQLENDLHQLPSWYCNLVAEAFNNLADNLNHRKEIANIYKKNVNPKILSSKITSLIDLSSNLRFPIFVNNREYLIKYLKKFGVSVSDIWYDAPIAPKKYLNQTDYQNHCPNAELASKEILNLPTHINISEKEAENICNLINQWLKSQ